MDSNNMDNNMDPMQMVSLGRRHSTVACFKISFPQDTQANHGPPEPHGDSQSQTSTSRAQSGPGGDPLNETTHPGPHTDNGSQAPLPDNDDVELDSIQGKLSSLNAHKFQVG